LISRPLGYIREAIQAYLFGATILVDAFVVSFNFPEMIQNLFFTGATSAFLIPVCSKYLGNREDLSHIYSLFINLAVLVTGAVSIFFLIFSTPIMGLIAPGFSFEGKVIARNLFIIMVPVILLHAVLSIMKAFLNAKEQFAAPELSGIVWNIVFILFAVLLSRRIGIYSLALGVSIGAVAQIIVQIPYLRRNGIRYRGFPSFRHPSVIEARRLFTGALIATSIVPINSFVGRVIGSYLPAGEVSSLAYAFRIFILPFSLFGVPAYTVLFSKISALYHDNDMRAMFSHIDSAIVLLCITLIPSTIFLCLWGDVFVKILYQRGAFTATETHMTYRALIGYSTGLLFYALSICFVRIFNAFHDMRTPAVIGLTSIALNALLAFLLMKNFGNLGISLATSIVSLYNFGLLSILFWQKKGYRPSPSTRLALLKTVAAGVALTFCIYFVRRALPASQYLSLAVSILAAAAIYGFSFKDVFVSFLRRSVRPAQL
jgi:putative peptidoglycan lipid II flippase